MVASEQRWREWREQTPVLRKYAYMNTGFSGPLRRAVVDAMRRRLQFELAHGPTTRQVLDDRFELVQRYRMTVGRLLGASPDEIAITGNTTEGINLIVNGPRRPRPR